jgi:hypothetical protein
LVKLQLARKAVIFAPELRRALKQYQQAPSDPQAEIDNLDFDPFLNAHVNLNVGTSTHVRLSLAPLKLGKLARSLFVIAAFCRLVFLQLPSDQKDMAEACGSRTHHSTREGPNHRL